MKLGNPIGHAVLALGVFAGLALADPARPANVEYLTAKASPIHYKGACPGMIRFAGVIHVSDPMTITYRWERSDGGVSPPRKIFVAGGSLRVETAWRLGTPAKAVRGAMRLRVLDPVSLYSGESSFTVACGGAVDPMAGGRRPDD